MLDMGTPLPEAKRCQTIGHHLAEIAEQRNRAFSGERVDEPLIIAHLTQRY
ncbi:MAG: hypothetical protein JWM11_1148 [Planctomycetaceae bacterium]|nr:hypothetical protein [Planctomycetaceae bacterium]